MTLPRVEQLERPVVDADDLGRLARALGPDYEAMAYLGAVLGLRFGECAGLRVGRVDVLGARLHVVEQATRGIGGATVLGPPKSAAGRRVLAMPSQLVEILAEHLRRRGLTAADSEAFVFVAPGGGILDYSGWRERVWLPAARGADLEGLTFHDLRRANATGLVSARVDLKTAQRRMGHSDPRLTLAVYAQATDTADEAVAESLGATFFDPPRDARAIDDVGDPPA